MGEPALVLVWPALLGYGEAAIAYVGRHVRPGRLARYAIWGVRLGWLAQTALLIAQAAQAEGFPWDSWAGSLNLFVWMCVGAYLIWGCRPRFRLLGLVVMPLAAVLLVLAWAAGGAGAPGSATSATPSSRSTSDSCWRRSPASRSPPASPPSTCGRSGG